MPQDPVLAAHGTDICRLTPRAIYETAKADIARWVDAQERIDRAEPYAFLSEHVRRAEGSVERLLEIAWHRTRPSRLQRFPMRADIHKASAIHLYRDESAMKTALEMARAADA